MEIVVIETRVEPNAAEERDTEIEQKTAQERNMETAEERHKKKTYIQNFRDKWLTDPRYEKWLMRIQGDNLKCTCKYCRCVFSAKLSDLERHRNTKKHQKAEFLYSNGQNGSYPPEEVADPCGEEMVEIERLIELVQEHPEIFDRNHAKHNKHYLLKIWRKIAAELGTEANLVEKKWNFLSKKYFIEKKRMCDSPTNSSDESNWSLLNSLRFLDDFPEPDNSKYKSKYSGLNECLEQIYYSSDNSETGAQTEKTQQNSRKITDEDPDFLFVCSLLPHMKKLEAIQSLEFREETCQLLKKKLMASSPTICYSAVTYSSEHHHVQNHESGPYIIIPTAQHEPATHEPPPES